MGFTDNEIIKMLNEFISRNEDVNYAAITIDLLKDILDLINRQKAENEKLRKRVNFVEQANVQLREELKETTEKFNCQQTVYADLSDIIREKNAEIERLQVDNSSMQSTLAKMSMGVEEAKAEAIKEFAERLKAECRQDRYSIQTTTKFGVLDKKYLRVVDEGDIDNLVKEMVGDSK